MPVQTNDLQEQFFAKFAFDRKKQELIGIERERFLINDKGKIVPRAEEFLKKINDSLWTYELSACQIEDRTVPTRKIVDIRKSLEENDQKAQCVADQLKLNLFFTEVADKDMPLDVYPDPRYLEITKTISRERLEAACRVAATQIHFGVGDIYKAIDLYNSLVGHLDCLCRMGDHSNGERLRLYRIMAQKWQPPFYENPDQFFQTAVKEGFADDPRNCWHLIRISKHGTIELRMLGATENINEILEWINTIKKLI